MAQAICYSEFWGNIIHTGLRSLSSKLSYFLWKKLLPDRRPILDKLQI
ncbi:hypothetical protein [Nostoc sp.]